MGAKRLSLFHRLGITLVILGMLQAIVPPALRPVRASLRVMGRLKVALALPGIADLSACLISADLPLAQSESEPEAIPDQEADQESHDTESLAETLAWTDGWAQRRSVQRSGSSLLAASVPASDAADPRTHSLLQRSRSLPILAALSSSVTTRLCRFTC